MAKGHVWFSLCARREPLQALGLGEADGNGWNGWNGTASLLGIAEVGRREKIQKKENETFSFFSLKGRRVWSCLDTALSEYHFFIT